MTEGSVQELVELIEEQASTVLLLVGILASLGFELSDLLQLTAMGSFA